MKCLPSPRRKSVPFNSNTETQKVVLLDLLLALLLQVEFDLQ